MRVEQAIPSPTPIRPHRPRLRRWLSAPASMSSKAWHWMTGDRPGYSAADMDIWLLVMAAGDCDGMWPVWPLRDKEPRARSGDDEYKNRREEPLRLPPH